jgi:hypothetical protein
MLVRKWIDKGHVAIDPDLFPELLIELRIAAEEEMSLVRTEYSMDLLDSLRHRLLILKVLLNWIEL